MYLSIKISRFSNLWFFASKSDLIKSDLKKCLLEEKVASLFYETNEKKVWKQIEKILGRKNTKEIKKSIFSLKPLFTLYWPKTLKNLLLWKQYFLNNQYLFQQIFLKLKK